MILVHILIFCVNRNAYSSVTAIRETRVQQLQKMQKVANLTFKPLLKEARFRGRSPCPRNRISSRTRRWQHLMLRMLRKLRRLLHMKSSLKSSRKSLKSSLKSCLIRMKSRWRNGFIWDILRRGGRYNRDWPRHWPSSERFFGPQRGLQIQNVRV